MKSRDISILLGLSSSFVVSLTYLIRPADPDQSAGGNFAWNLMFYFPMIALESSLALVSFLFFISYLRQPIRKSWWGIVVPPMLALPCAYELCCTGTVLFAILRMARGVTGR